MQLNQLETAMVAGELGEATQIAIKHQIAVGDFFGAHDFVEVTQAHVMADTESLGQAGVMWLERLGDTKDEMHAVRVPTITDPRGTDFAHASALGQVDWMLALERRAICALEKLGVSMTDTCVNYQTVLCATRGEHVAFGDTGVVIYSNSVNGARSNYEGGPSAISAGITGRTPRYGFHLDVHRQATLRLQVDFTPATLDEWGALGGVIGRLAGNYWEVPLLEGIDRAPTSDEFKHFGAAMASFGSVALFHLLGITPEAMRASDVAAERLTVHQRITRHDIDSLMNSYSRDKKVDVVVFSAPQLSLFEMKSLAELCDGKQFQIPLLAITSPQTKPDADRFGYSARIEAAGGSVLSGMCFYNSYAREIGEAKGWKRLLSNSAKLVNILGGYGYVPSLASMKDCVAAAQTGELP